MRRLFYSALICLLFAPTLLFAQSKTYFIASNGSDSNRGTITSPFATIKKSIETIREQRKKGDNASYTICLRKGNYEVASTIELATSDRNITITPYQKEAVILMGGKSIDSKQAKPVLESPYESMFQKSAVSNILYVNLRELGITNYGKLHNVGFSRPNAPAWMELFVDGNPYQLARWPNKGSIPIGKVIDEGSIPRNGDYSNRGAIFTYSDSHPSSWKSASDIWISGYFRYGYAEDAIRIASIDTVKKTISTDKPHRYGFGSGSPWNSWYAYNIAQEIDQEGEYYIDKENGLLFFYASKKPSTLEVSMLKTPMMALEGAKDITIRNIAFTCTRGMGVYMERSESCLVKDCQFSNIGSMAVCIGKGVDEPTDGSHGELGKPASRVVGNLQEYIYENTTFNREGGRKNGIVNCQIFNTGAGGILLSGGDRLTLTPANNYVENCTIHDFNRIEKSYRAGIDISGVGNRISNCEIYSAPSMAIILHGNDHLIEYCDIHDVCLEVDDQGALYYGRDPSESGHMVRFNYFHHLGNEHRTTAVYHDDGACGMAVYGNIFLKAGTLPSLIGGGSHNSYQNNLFIDSPTAIHIDNRLQNWAASMIANKGIYMKRLNAVNHTKPPYSIRYPWIATYWNDSLAKPQHNLFDGNIFCKIGKLVHGDIKDLEWSSNNVEIKDYPQSWSNRILDRKFIPTADSLQQPKGWKRIPVEKIGVKNRR